MFSILTFKNKICRAGGLWFLYWVKNIFFLLYFYFYFILTGLVWQLCKYCTFMMGMVIKCCILLKEVFYWPWMLIELYIEKPTIYREPRHDWLLPIFGRFLLLQVLCFPAAEANASEKLSSFLYCGNCQENFEHFWQLSLFRRGKVAPPPTLPPPPQKIEPNGQQTWCVFMPEVTADLFGLLMS